MADKPFGWTAYFIGVEGYRESVHAEADTSDVLFTMREKALKVMTGLGFVPDVKKLFDDNGSKSVGQGSKLDKFKKPEIEIPLNDIPEDQMLRAAREVLAPANAALAEAVQEKIEGIAFQKPSAAPLGKLAKFLPKETVAPAPVAVVASAPNVSPKLSKFVAKEKKGE